ncbi:hypothetical protein [[Phormidium ambiguum] IAM M-71]|nr:hypothetical protein [Phormidium ambiguum]
MSRRNFKVYLGLSNHLCDMAIAWYAIAIGIVVELEKTGFPFASTF